MPKHTCERNPYLADLCVACAANRARERLRAEKLKRTRPTTPTRGSDE